MLSTGVLFGHCLWSHQVCHGGMRRGAKGAFWHSTDITIGGPQDPEGMQLGTHIGPWRRLVQGEDGCLLVLHPCSGRAQRCRGSSVWYALKAPRTCSEAYPAEAAMVHRLVHARQGAQGRGTGQGATGGVTDRQGKGGGRAPLCPPGHRRRYRPSQTRSTSARYCSGVRSPLRVSGPGNPLGEPKPPWPCPPSRPAPLSMAALCSLHNLGFLAILVFGLVLGQGHSYSPRAGPGPGKLV